MQKIVRSPLGRRLEVLDLRNNAAIDEAVVAELESDWDGIVRI